MLIEYIFFTFRVNFHGRGLHVISCVRVCVCVLSVLIFIVMFFKFPVKRKPACKILI